MGRGRGSKQHRRPHDGAGSPSSIPSSQSSGGGPKAGPEPLESLAIEEAANRFRRASAHGHGIDHRGRPTHGVAAGKEPFNASFAGHRIGHYGVADRGLDNPGPGSQKVLSARESKHEQHRIVSCAEFGEAQSRPS